MEIETTKTHLQSIWTFLSMFHIFSHTEEFPQKKGDREKKGRHNHTSSMLWDKNCGIKI